MRARSPLEAATLATACLLASFCLPNCPLCTAASLDFGAAQACGSMFAAAPNIEIPPLCFSLETGDLNGDDIPDLVTISNLDPTLTVCLGNGDGTFQVLQRGFGQGLVAGPLALGDLNGDGHEDAIADVPYPDRQLRILLGDGTGKLEPAGAGPEVGLGVNYLELADLNRDGRLDLLAGAEQYPDSLSILFGHGDGTFELPVRYPVSGERLAKPIVCDLNSDGWPDIVAEASTGRAVSVLLAEGNGLFHMLPPIDPPEVEVISGMVEADWNGDGRPDLAVMGATYDYPISSKISTLLGTGTGEFSAGPVYLSLNLLIPSAVADFDQDGRPDIITNAYPTGLLVLRGLGDGSFMPIDTIRPHYFVGDLTALDLNRDGLPDIATLATTNWLITIGLNLGPPVAAGVTFMPDRIVQQSAGGSMSAVVTLPPSAASIGLDLTSIRISDVAPISVEQSGPSRGGRSYRLKFSREAFSSLGLGAHELDLRACLLNGRGVRGEATLNVTASPRRGNGSWSARLSSRPGRVPIEVAWEEGPMKVLTCEVFNVQGQRVSSIAAGAGSPRGISWDGRNLSGGLVPAGVYFLRVGTTTDARVFKAVIVR